MRIIQLKKTMRTREATLVIMSAEPDGEEEDAGWSEWSGREKTSPGATRKTGTPERDRPDVKIPGSPIDKHTENKKISRYPVSLSLLRVHHYFPPLIPLHRPL